MKRDNYLNGYKGLAIYQIAGGGLGLFFLIQSLSVYLIAGILPAFHLISGVLVYGFSVFCGIILLQSRTSSLQLSLINQYIQLVAVAGSGIVFKCVSGFSMAFGLQVDDSTTMGLQVSLSNVSVLIGEDFGHREVRLNLIAGGIIMFLHSEMKALSREKMRDEIGSIGSEV